MSDDRLRVASARMGTLAAEHPTAATAMTAAAHDRADDACALVSRPSDDAARGRFDEQVRPRRS